MGAFIDITGQQFGNWVVIEYDKTTKKWLCECQCENRTKRLIASADLRKGKTTNCGCSRKKNLVGKEFKHLVVDSYAGDYHWNCHCKDCGRQFVVHTYHLEHDNIPACNHNGLHANIDDITGRQFNDWTVLSYAGNKYWNCRCSCGVERKVLGKELKSGRSKSCGHNYKYIDKLINSDSTFIDLTGKQFNDWTVIEYAGNQHWKCRCSCGNIGNISSYSLRSGDSKSCGHNSGKLKNILNETFGELTAIEYVGEGKWKCRCSCGNETIVHGHLLRSGHTKSCGDPIHRYNNLSGRIFGDLTVLKYKGKMTWECKCSCGNTVNVLATNLVNGHTRSCGCKTYINRITKLINSGRLRYRDANQLNALKSEQNMRKFIGNKKVTLKELADKLGVSYCYLLSIKGKYNIEDLINYNTGVSQLELDLYNYIKSIYSGTILQHDRNILQGKELDIYIPEKRLAIEFNGTYWHCDELINKNYHQQKTIDCIKNKIQLIHIFEYEWLDDNKQRLIKQLLNDKLCNSKIYYARQLNIKEVAANDEMDFLNKYHIQGFTSSRTAIGLYDNNELLAIMTFGSPRFNNNFECEIIRMCFKSGISIVGGSERMLKHYIDKYKPKNIVSYCDLSKFSGDSYLRLGFKTDSSMLTTPNYVWVSSDRNEVLTRYQTQKEKLVNLGLDKYGSTENEIMKSLDYLKIYDAGNIRFEMQL